MNPNAVRVVDAAAARGLDIEVVVRTATGYPIGGVPPFGHTTAVPTFVDRDLLRLDLVWAAAGTPRTCSRSRRQISPG